MALGIGCAVAVGNGMGGGTGTSAALASDSGRDKAEVTDEIDCSKWSAFLHLGRERDGERGARHNQIATSRNPPQQWRVDSLGRQLHTLRGATTRQALKPLVRLRQERSEASYHNLLRCLRLRGSCQSLL